MKSPSACQQTNPLSNKRIPIRFVMPKKSTYSDVFSYNRQEPAQCCKHCCFFTLDNFREGYGSYGSCKYHDALLEFISKEGEFDFDDEKSAFDERGYGICPHFCTLDDMLKFKEKSYDEIVLDQSIRAGMGPEELLFTEILDGKKSSDVKKATDKMMKYVNTILKNAEVLDPDFPPVMITSDSITPTGYVYNIDLSTNYERVHAFIAKHDKAARELFKTKTYSWRGKAPYRYAGLALGNMLGSDMAGSYAQDALKQLMGSGIFDDPKEIDKVLQ